MNNAVHPLRRVALREAALFLGLLFFGLVLMPIGIYQFGQELFGHYGGQGYGDFFGTLSGKIRNGEAVAWFLILSPYLVWQAARLAITTWRAAGKPRD